MIVTSYCNTELSEMGSLIIKVSSLAVWRSNYRMLHSVSEWKEITFYCPIILLGIALSDTFSVNFFYINIIMWLFVKNGCRAQLYYLQALNLQKWPDLLKPGMSLRLQTRHKIAKSSILYGRLVQTCSYLNGLNLSTISSSFQACWVEQLRY